MGAIDLDDIKSKLNELKDNIPPEPESTPVTTAFLVVQQPDGQWAAFAEFADVDIKQDRLATFDDIVGGCSNVILGCQINQTAMQTIVMMEQRAQQVQQQMRAQAESQRVASLLDPSKLRNG